MQGFYRGKFMWGRQRVWRGGVYRGVLQTVVRGILYTSCREDNVPFVLCSLVPYEASFSWGAGDNLSFPNVGASDLEP